MKTIVKGLVFLFILSALFVKLGLIISEKKPSVKRWDEFNNIEKNDIDILIMGNSHAYCALNPQIFNAKLHVNSFNLSSASQNIIQTYFNLKEVLKKQKPKLIILEGFVINQYESKNEFWKACANIDGTPLSLNKVNRLRYEFDSEDYLDALFPLIRNHLNWKKKKLIIENLISENGNNIKQLNYGFDGNVFTGIRALPKQVNNVPYVINKDFLKYSKKFFELCARNNIPVILTFAPDYEGIVGKYNVDSYMNQLDSIAQSHNIEFVNLFNVTNWNTQHFRDDLHMNVPGSNAASTYLADWVKGKYQNIGKESLTPEWIYKNSYYPQYYNNNPVINNVLPKIKTDPSHLIVGDKTVVEIENIQVNNFDNKHLMLLFKLGPKTDKKFLEDNIFSVTAYTYPEDSPKLPQQRRPHGSASWDYPIKVSCNDDNECYIARDFLLGNGQSITRYKKILIKLRNRSYQAITNEIVLEDVNLDIDPDFLN